MFLIDMSPLADKCNKIWQSDMNKVIARWFDACPKDAG